MDVIYWPTPIYLYPIGKVDEQLDSIRKCLNLEADYLFLGHELPWYGCYNGEDYLKDLLVKQRQLERRLRVVLSRNGAMTAPDLHRESLVIKERYDYPTTAGSVTELPACRATSGGCSNEAESNGSISMGRSAGRSPRKAVPRRTRSQSTAATSERSPSTTWNREREAEIGAFPPLTSTDRPLPSCGAEHRQSCEVSV